MSYSSGTNTLLAALPLRERTRIAERCEQITLHQGEVLAEPGGRIENVHFPADSFIITLASIKTRSTIGLGLIGREGMLGSSLVLGVNLAPQRAQVQGSGSALRMGAGDLHRILDASPAFAQRLRSYLYLQLRQMPHTGACAVFHVVERRLAYWLLMLHDRVAGDRINLTHEDLASMLGVRRSGVSTAAGVLQRNRLISYSRGHIDILDRPGLEAAACSCYRSERLAKKRLAASSSYHAIETSAAPLGLHA